MRFRLRTIFLITAVIAIAVFLGPKILRTIEARKLSPYVGKDLSKLTQTEVREFDNLTRRFFDPVEPIEHPKTPFRLWRLESGKMLLLDKTGFFGFSTMMFTLFDPHEGTSTTADMRAIGVTDARLLDTSDGTVIVALDVQIHGEEYADLKTQYLAIHNNSVIRIRNESANGDAIPNTWQVDVIDRINPNSPDFNRQSAESLRNGSRIDKLGFLYYLQAVPRLEFQAEIIDLTNNDDAWISEAATLALRNLSEQENAK